jgi:hypothetical protein
MARGYLYCNFRLQRRKILRDNCARSCGIEVIITALYLRCGGCS